jgi:NAD(P)-dependent dehydrogenase (short-subunit alcohol dehydrogenase family)
VVPGRRPRGDRVTHAPRAAADASPACALLIGNSDGIGLALARALLARGWRVVGVSRRAAPVAHAAYRHAVLDVCADDYGAALAAALPPDPIALCVYCAGIGDLFDATALARDVATLRTNLLGLALTIERVLPRMAASPPAVLAGLSSMADVIRTPAAPAYGASKAGMSHYLESLALALRGSGVRVVNVRLGFVDTKMAKAPWKPWLLTPDRAAERILAALLAARPPRRVDIPRRMAVLARVVGWASALARS